MDEIALKQRWQHKRTGDVGRVVMYKEGSQGLMVTLLMDHGAPETMNERSLRGAFELVTR